MNLSVFRLALRNIRRKPARAIALVLAIAIASGALFSSIVMLSTVENTVSLGIKRLGADLLVVPMGYESSLKTAIIAGEPQHFYMDREIERKVAQIQGVDKVSSQIFLSTSTYLVCCDLISTFMVGFDPETDFTVQPWLAEKLNRPFRKGDVIVGASIPVYKGFSTIVYGKYFTCYGRLERTYVGILDKAMFISYRDVYWLAEETKKNPYVARLDIKPDEISVVLVRVETGANITEVKEEIESKILGVRVITAQDIMLDIKRQLLAVFGGLQLLGGVIWVANTLLIFAVFSAIIRERQREYGILRAIGARRLSIFKLVIYEAVLLAVIGLVLGVLTASVLLLGTKDAILRTLIAEFPYLLPSIFDILEAVFLCAGVAVGSSVIGALSPALLASKTEPYDAIRGA